MSTMSTMSMMAILAFLALVAIIVAFWFIRQAAAISASLLAIGLARRACAAGSGETGGATAARIRSANPWA